jgi:hypothetical protein
MHAEQKAKLILMVNNIVKANFVEGKSFASDYDIYRLNMLQRDSDTCYKAFISYLDSLN